MRIGNFEFSPGLWPTLATLAILPFFLALGAWQLERAAWKQGLVDTEAELTQLAPAALLDVLDSAAPRDYRPVYMTGRYDLEHQLLLDNRIYQRRPGYEVLTPLRLKDRQAVVLVNRGWVPLGQSRAQLPDVPGPAAERLVTGTIARLPEKVFRLDAAEESHAGWPQVIQNIDLEAIGQRLGQAVIPVVVLLDMNDTDGFARDWQPVYGIMPDKHRAYAMQWFSLALVLIIIYVGVNTRRNGKQDSGN
ncbi:MAG TPA: SURF1 family protein [Gammaproteobacteria bacterium]|jgi:surfeit locus 1 family protein|nr:SURF1 family protein [Gammaproteobacteria bacterium]